MTRSFWLFGARFTVHASHEDAAGHYDIVEGCAPPGFQTPPAPAQPLLGAVLCPGRRVHDLGRR
jgi:hypothetical protein